MASEDRCLKCGAYAEGAVYPFYVQKFQWYSGIGRGRTWQTIREERPFICTRCADGRLRWQGRSVLFGCAPLGLVVSALLMNAGVLVYLHRATWRRGPFVVALGLIAAGLVALSLSLNFIWRAWKQLRYVRPKLYRFGTFPNPSVTQMAIDLRKKSILQELRLPNARELRFVTEADYRRLPGSDPPVRE
jgi:hypothetical protein